MFSAKSQNFADVFMVGAIILRLHFFSLAFEVSLSNFVSLGVKGLFPAAFQRIFDK